MRITMRSEENLEFSDFDNPAFEVITTSPEQAYSALQMFATAMALCTYSVLAGYGETIEVDTADITIGVRWEYLEKPFRIGAIAMDIRWPQLPESRLQAARRAASFCTLHQTLEHPPQVVTEVGR